MKSILRGRRAVPSAAAMGLLVLASAWAGTARAQDITAARAQSLEGQVRAALTGLFGPHIPLGDHPVQITADGDHFNVAVPMAGPAVKGPPLTAALRPLDHGRWALDEILFPSPLTITLPGSHGGPPGKWTLSMQSQDQHAVFDPTGATPSTWDGTVKGYASDWRQGTNHEQSRTEVVTGHAVWQPVGGGRGNLTATQTADGMSSTFTLPVAGTVALAIGHTAVKAHFDAVDLNALGSIVRSGVDLAPAAAEAAKAARGHYAGAGKSPPPRITKADQASMQTALTGVEGLMSGFGEVLALEHVSVHSKAGNATLQGLKVGFGFSAPEGKLRLRLLIGFDGLDSPALPPPMRADLPSHFLIAAEVRGVPATQVAALLNQAVERGPAAHAPVGQWQTLLDHGPVTFAVDKLSLAVGPATLKATGEVSMSKPMLIEGKALIAATGLDALIHQAQTDPMLKQAEPSLLLLKGLGKADGTATIWNVTYKGGRVVVNGNDLSAMMQGRH